MAVDRKRDWHVLYLLCMLCILGGVCLIMFSSQRQQLVQEFRSFGETLLSVGLIGLIFQFFFHTSMEKRIVEVLSELKKSVVPEIAKQAEELGIKRILIGRYEFDEMRLGLYKEAKSVSWMANGVNLPVKHNFVDSISDCLEKGVEFKFLTSANYSAIKDVLECLMRVKDKTSPGQIEVKLYKGHPRWYVQIIDSKIYAQPYLHGVEISQMPMFEIEKGEKGRDYYEFFSRHFTLAWEDAMTLEEFLLDSTKGKGRLN